MENGNENIFFCLLPYLSFKLQHSCLFQNKIISKIKKNGNQSFKDCIISRSRVVIIIIISDSNSVTIITLCQLFCASSGSSSAQGHVICQFQSREVRLFFSCLPFPQVSSTVSFSLVKSDFFFMSSFYIGFFHWDHLAHLSHNCLLSFVYITSPYQFIHISCTLHLFPLIFSLSLNSSVRCHSCILTLHMQQSMSTFFPIFVHPAHFIAMLLSCNIAFCTQASYNLPFIQRQNHFYQQK